MVREITETPTWKETYELRMAIVNGKITEVKRLNRL